MDTSLFRPGQRNLLKESYGIEGQVVLFVGRLTKDKAPEAVLKAFHRVKSAVPRAKLVMLGKGREEARLKELQMDLRLEDVCFLGRVPRDDMPFIYSGAQVLVLPSVFEIFGNVVLEAMATGVPMIGSKIAGMADVITHGETGFHIRPGDVDQLAAYMLRLLTDHNLRSEIAEAARKSAVERFDDMSVARAVERTYDDCLRQRDYRRTVGTVLAICVCLLNNSRRIAVQNTICDNAKEKRVYRSFLWSDGRPVRANTITPTRG